MSLLSSVRGAWMALAVACAASVAGGYQIYSSACSQEFMLLHSLTTLSHVAAQQVVAALPPRSDGTVNPAEAAADIRVAMGRAMQFPIGDGRSLAPIDSAFRVVLLDPKGHAVARMSPREGVGIRERDSRVRVALGGSLAGYALEVTPREWLSRDLAEGLWTWQRAQVAIAILTISALVLMAVAYHLHRDRSAARLRENFIASVSHELRTPLAQIRMFAELLRMDWVRSPEERDRSIRIIDQEARRLTSLVENVLQFSATERVSPHLALEGVELSALTDDVIRGFIPAAKGAGMGIRCQVEPGLHARANADALRQVFVNLVDNAVKYGERGGSVRVSAAPTDGGRIALVVENDGRGIAPRDRHRIFEPFVRSYGAEEVIGSGIGLAVVKDLVIRMNGTVQVDDAVSGGARFTVRLDAHQRSVRVIVRDEPAREIDFAGAT